MALSVGHAELVRLGELDERREVALLEAVAAAPRVGRRYSLAVTTAVDEVVAALERFYGAHEADAGDLVAEALREDLPGLAEAEAQRVAMEAAQADRRASVLWAREALRPRLLRAFATDPRSREVAVNTLLAGELERVRSRTDALVGRVLASGERAAA